MLLVKYLVKTMMCVMLGGFVVTFVIKYIQIEHPAYLWDYGLYYNMYQKLGALAVSDLHAAVDFLLNSIRSEDYNASSMAMLLPAYLLLGSGRLAYILGITCLFLIPATLVAFCLAAKAYNKEIPYSSKTAALLFVILFPPFWQSPLRGLPDIVGLITLGLAAILFIESDFLAKKSLRNAVGIGVLIWITFLFRRWYAYSCVSLMMCAFVMAIGSDWKKNKSFIHLLNVVAYFVIVAVIVVGFLLISQFDLVYRIFNTSYVDIYKAYQEPLFSHVLRYYYNSGPIFVALAVSGIILSIKNKYNKVLFIAASGVLSFLLFSTTQSPGIHHALPVYMFLMPIALVPIFTLFDRLSLYSRVAVVIPIFVVLMGVFLVTFSPKAHRVVPFFTTIAPHNTYFPLHLQNYDEYQRLIHDVHQKLGEGDTMAVFASSEFLADALLYELDRTLRPHISWVSQVDERDGFRITSLQAKYAIIATPTPIHLPESSQRVITVPAEMIRTGTGFGRDYRLVSGPYKLANGYLAYLYERSVPLTIDAIRNLEASLKAFHQSWVWDGKDRVSAQ